MSGWPYEFPPALSGRLDDAGLPAEDFRVMLHICRRCGDGSNGRACDSSVLSMAKVCRLNADTVRRILKRLVDQGWLSATERAGKTTSYQPRFADPSPETQPLPLDTTPLKLEGLCLEGDHPSSFKGDEGKPLRDTKKGNLRSPDKSRGTEDEVITFCIAEGLTEKDGRASFHRWEANGWTINGKPLKNWKAQIRQWKAGGYHPSQKERPATSSSNGAHVIGNRVFKS